MITDTYVDVLNKDWVKDAALAYTAMGYVLQRTLACELTQDCKRVTRGQLRSAFQ
ncbi:MAG: hypothetical protein J07HQX50_01450 [Haloquadratum sp. J07HQX50]|nr:MAG: hypothetical protein J07HQX50_01450 [Haloquadratum sp. J07HQX50]